jgi:hypothetical protein
MKIIYTNNVPVVTFKDIPVGKCFIDTDGEVCIRISQEIDCHINSFCFSDNKTYGFSDCYPVRPVEVELVVHKEEV